LGAFPGDPSPFASGISFLESQNRLAKNFAYARAVLAGDPFEGAALLDAQTHGNLARRIRDIPKLPKTKTLHRETNGIADRAQTTLRA